jgi:hypothetical protein
MIMKHVALLAIAALLPGVANASQPAPSLSLNAQYFKVLSSPDFGIQIGGTYTDEVKSALGPNGLPVSNPGYLGPLLNDVDPNTGELKWWTADGVNKLADGTGVISAPFSNFAMFPAGETTNSHGFRTAIFSGILHLPSAQSFQINFGADDDALLYIDGLSIGQIGGIHPIAFGVANAGMLGAGDHQFRLFYADRFPTQAALTLGNSIPEPASWALMIAGFGLTGAAIRRRAKVRVAFS